MRNYDDVLDKMTETVNEVARCNNDRFSELRQDLAELRETLNTAYDSTECKLRQYQVWTQGSMQVQQEQRVIISSLLAEVAVLKNRSKWQVGVVGFMGFVVAMGFGAVGAILFSIL